MTHASNNRADADRESARTRPRGRLWFAVLFGMLATQLVGVRMARAQFAPVNPASRFQNPPLRSSNAPQRSGPQAFGSPSAVNSPGGFRNASPAAGGPDYRTAAVPTIPSISGVEDTPAVEQGVAESSESWQPPALVSRWFEGGWLMLPLAVCALVVFALTLERMIALRRGRVIPRPFVRRFTESVEDGQLSYDEANEICEEFDCPVAEVFQAAVRRWGRPMFEIEQAVLDAGDRVSDSLRRFVRVFHAIANVAPLIGLLGTVLGMIEAFETISSAESIGRPEMLASGISKALLTTAGGLSVAIPAYLAFMYFSSKSDRYLGEIDKLCQKVIDSISAEGLESSSQPKSSSRKRRAA